MICGVAGDVVPGLNQKSCKLPRREPGRGGELDRTEDRRVVGLDHYTLHPPNSSATSDTVRPRRPTY